MLVRADIDCVVDPIDNVATVARQQRSDVDVSLLQFLIGIELIKRSLQLPLSGFVPGHLRPVKSSAQPFKLVVDLAPASFERVCQSWIDGAQLLAQLIKLTIN